MTHNPGKPGGVRLRGISSSIQSSKQFKAHEMFISVTLFEAWDTKQWTEGRNCDFYVELGTRKVLISILCD